MRIAHFPDLRQMLATLHLLTIPSLLVLTLCLFTGCQTSPKKERVPKEISYTVPKWKHIGTISRETPTVTRILKTYTGNMSTAIHIIQSNHHKYSKSFYKVLPFGASVYISDDAELFINPNGGNAPDTVIIKHKPNPEYSFEKRPYHHIPTTDDGSTRVIYEEDLKK